MTPEQRDELIDIHLARRTMTPEQRDELIDNYAWEIVDGMDVKDLCRMAAEQIASNMEDYTDDQVIEEVKEYYPHLLEG